MTITIILAIIGAISLAIGAAARVPKALALFVRSCIPLAKAIGELRTAIAETSGRRAGDTALDLGTSADHPTEVVAANDS